jgi:hypothetical protein
MLPNHTKSLSFSDFFLWFIHFNPIDSTRLWEISTVQGAVQQVIGTGSTGRETLRTLSRGKWRWDKSTVSERKPPWFSGENDGTNVV